MSTTCTINKKTFAQVERVRSQGVKKSWEQARALHDSSDNHRSTPAVARSFLSTITTEGKSNQQVLKEYDTFIGGYKSQRKKRRTNRTTTTRRMLNVRTSTTTPVDQLILIKNFMRTNNIDIHEMKNLVDCLEKIQRN
jgi:hypothetical protein